MGANTVQFTLQGRNPVQVIIDKASDLGIGRPPIKKRQEFEFHAKMIRGISEFLPDLQIALTIDVTQVQSRVPHEKTLF